MNFKKKLIEENHEEYDSPKQIKLSRFKTKMRCCKVLRILWYHYPNYILYPEKHARLFRATSENEVKFLFCKQLF